MDEDMTNPMNYDAFILDVIWDVMIEDVYF